MKNCAPDILQLYERFIAERDDKEGFVGKTSNQSAGHDWNFVTKDFPRRRHDQRFHLNVVTRSGIGHDLKLAKFVLNYSGVSLSEKSRPFRYLSGY